MIKFFRKIRYNLMGTGKTICHSCEGRNLQETLKWIPACAGMTITF